MPITSDWHIHSRNSCDGACMVVADLIAGAAAKGVTDFGLTDHLHTRYTLPDVAASREEFLANDPSPRFHFGVEVSVISRWELDEIAAGRQDDAKYGLRTGGPPDGPLAIVLGPEHIEQWEIEYVVGGAHWPMYGPLEREAIIRDYHRQNMFLATHPLVDIVAHPWWWMGDWQDEDGIYRTKPWFDDFGAIPQSMHDEFAAAVVENGSIVEINIGANLLNPEYADSFAPQYLEYLAGLKARGAKLCIGSDCHEAQYDPDLAATAAMLEAAGIEAADLWCLAPRSD